MTFARTLKIALLLLAAFLTIWLFFTTESVKKLDLSGLQKTDEDLNRAEQKARENLSKVSPVDLSATTVTQQPRFVGRDVQGRKWKVEAERARHQGLTDETGELDLDKVAAEAESAEGEVFTFEADEGSYDRADEALSLKKNVKIEGYGLQMTTDEVNSDLKNNRAWGTKPISITGPQGEVFADEFEILHNGDKIRLGGKDGGRVHGRFFTEPDQPEISEE